MADGSLYPAGAQLLEASGQEASSIASDKLKEKEITQQAGAEAGRGLDQQKLAMLNHKLDEQANLLQVTPQLALGLVKNTGDKSWLQAIGQKMRADVYTALYTHGINSKISGKEYKVTIGDKIHTLVPRFNQDTNDFDFETIGEGEKFSPTQKGEDTPKAKADRESRERTSHNKGRSGKGGSGEDPKDKEFLKTYRGYQKDTEGMNYTLLDQLGKKDPKQAQDMKTKMDFISKNQERFNKLQGVNPNDSHGTPNPDQVALPDPAKDAVKKANGQPVRFNNGQIWKYEKGQFSQVK